MAISDKLTQIANNVPLVYKAGYNKGKAEGGDTTEAYNQGIEAGKIAQKEDFWDKFTTAYNSAGKPIPRVNYNNAFSYWNGDAFYPAKNLNPNSLYTAFSYFNEYGTPLDLKQRLIDCGVTLNTQNVTSAQSCFTGAYISVLPTMDFGKCTNFVAAFASPSIETIEKIILKSDGTQTFVATFNDCRKLKEIRFEGVIGTSISFAQSPLLSADSVADIIAHLGTVTTEQTITFHADIELSAEQEATIQGKGWTLVQ
jgi:hypothetical protein